MSKPLPASPKYIKVRSTLVKKVFPELRSRHNMSAWAAYPHTQTTARYQIKEKIRACGKSRGFVFWTIYGNNDEPGSFRSTGRVYLYYDLSVDEYTDEELLAVARTATKVCRKHGLRVKWNRTTRDALEVTTRP